jgi:hypothetical protein
VIEAVLRIEPRAGESLEVLGVATVLERAIRRDGVRVPATQRHTCAARSPHVDARRRNGPGRESRAGRASTGTEGLTFPIGK